jgi:hypothetical protein
LHIVLFFYPDALKVQTREMAEDDQGMKTRVKKILENWVTDKTSVDNMAQKIVLAAHRHTYSKIMNSIRRFQFKGNSTFLANIVFLGRVFAFLPFSRVAVSLKRCN